MHRDGSHRREQLSNIWHIGSVVDMVRIEPTPTLPERVAAQLRERILAGEFPVGSLLPGEVQLAQELGVSRNSVREALRALVHAGLLGARAGYGTYVRATSDVAPALIRQLEHTRASDVTEVRGILEREAARFAAQRASTKQVRSLREALVERTRAHDGLRSEDADLEFHRLLLEASGNALLLELYRGIGGNEQAIGQLGLDDQMPGLAEIDDAHEAIVDAVASRDVDLAGRAADHLIALLTEHTDPADPCTPSSVRTGGVPRSHD